MFDGILLINKPKGWTSHDVVAKVRGILKKEAGKKIKVGHTGTLDPLATGLMILVVGKYCKRAAEFSKLDKTYEATIRLGKTSTTADAEGEKTKISDRKPTIKEVEQALQTFEGQIEQIPPAYSAIKIDGKRAYQLARAGKEVNIEPRKVTIYYIKLESYKYPEIKFTTKVSSGTYIRTLAEDIGKKLEAGAYLSDLKRTEIDKFSIKQASTVENLTEVKLQDLLTKA